MPNSSLGSIKHNFDQSTSFGQAKEAVLSMKEALAAGEYSSDEKDSLARSLGIENTEKPKEANPFFEKIQEDIGHYLLRKHSAEGNERTKSIELKAFLTKIDKDLIGFIQESDTKGELKDIFAYIKDQVDDEAMQEIRQTNELRKTVWDRMRGLNAERKMKADLAKKIENQYTTAGPDQNPAIADLPVAETQANMDVSPEVVEPVAEPAFDPAAAEDKFAETGSLAAEVGEDSAAPVEPAAVEAPIISGEPKVVESEAAAPTVAPQPAQAEAVIQAAENGDNNETPAPRPVREAAFDSGKLVDEQIASPAEIKQEETGLIKTGHGGADVIRGIQDNIKANYQQNAVAPRPDFFTPKSHLDEAKASVPQTPQSPVVEQAPSGDDGLQRDERRLLEAAEQEGEKVLTVQAEEAPAEEVPEVIKQEVEPNQAAQVDASPVAVETSAAETPGTGETAKPGEVWDISDQIRARDEQKTAEQPVDGVVANQPPGEVIDIRKQIEERDGNRPGAIRRFVDRLLGREVLTADQFYHPEAESVLRSEEGDIAAAAATAQEEQARKAA